MNHVCQSASVSRFSHISERKRSAGVLAQCSHLVIPRVRVTRCGIETTANIDIVANRRVTVNLRADTKGMNYYEDFESFFSDVCCHPACHACVCARSGLPLTLRCFKNECWPVTIFSGLANSAAVERKSTRSNKSVFQKRSVRQQQ